MAHYSMKALAFFGGLTAILCFSFVPPQVYAQASVQAKKTADTSIVLSGDAASSPGGTVSYHMVVRNDGPSQTTITRSSLTLSPKLVVKDIVPAGLCTQEGTMLTCDLGAMQPQASVSIDITLDVAADAVCATQLKSKGVVTSTPRDPKTRNNKASISTLVDCTSMPVDLVLSAPVALPNPVKSGKLIRFQQMVTSAGPGTATNVGMTTNIPEYATFIPGESFLGCTSDGSAIVCKDIPVGKKFTIAFNMSSSAPCGNITYSAAASGDQEDPNLSNNVQTMIAGVQCPPSADLSVSLSETTTVEPGEDFSIAMTVLNAGPTPSKDLDRATLRLPKGMSIVGVDSHCKIIGTSVVSCSLPALSPAESIVLLTTLQVSSSVCDETLTSTAIVKGRVKDPNPGNNQATLETSVECISADLSLSEPEIASYPVRVGEQIVITQIAANAGPSTPEHVDLHAVLVETAGGDVPVFDDEASYTSCEPNVDDPGTIICRDVPLDTPIAVVFTFPADAQCPTVTSYHVLVESELSDPNKENNAGDINWIDVECSDNALEVSLNPQSPTEDTVARGSVVQMTSIDFTAPCSQPVLLESITILHEGFGAIADFQGIFASMDGRRVSRMRQFDADQTADIRFMNPIEIPACETETIDFVGVFDRNAVTASEHGLTIELPTDIVSDAPEVQGVFPVRGDEFRLAAVQAGQVDVTYKPVDSSIVLVGDTEVAIGKSEFSIDTTEDQTFYTMLLQNDGTAVDGDFTNIRVRRMDGTVLTNSVPQTVADYASLVFDPPLPVLEEDKITLEFIADIVGGEDQTIRMQYEEPSDLFSVGSLYGYGVNGQLYGSTINVTNAPSDVRIGNGSLNLSIDGPDSQMYEPDDNDAVMAVTDFSFESGSSADIESMWLLLWGQTETGQSFCSRETEQDGLDHEMEDYVTDVELRNTVTGQTVDALIQGGGCAGDKSYAEYELSDFVVPSGASSWDLRLDFTGLPQDGDLFRAYICTADANDPVGCDFGGNVPASTQFNLIASDLQSGAPVTDINPGEDINGNVHTVHTPTLNVAEKSIGLSDTVDPNQKDVNLFRFEAKAGEGGDLLLTKIELKADSGALENAVNFTLWVDTDSNGVIDTILEAGQAAIGDTVIFNDLVGGGYVIPTGQAVIFEAHGDIAALPQSNMISVGFDDETQVFVEAEELDDGTSLQCIHVNLTGECTEPQIFVFTVQSKVFTINGVCGDGVVQEDEQCDDGNPEGGDGCSAQCSIEDLAGHLSLTEKSMGSHDTTVENEKDVPFFRFEATAGAAADVLFGGFDLKADEGDLQFAENYTLWADTDANGDVDTIIEDRVGASGGKVRFAFLTPPDTIIVDPGYLITAGQSVIFEVHADIAGSLADASQLSIGFDDADGAPVVHEFAMAREGASDGAWLYGISVNGVSMYPVTNIDVFTVTSKVYELVEAGTLFVSQDSTPVRNRQLLAGELSDVVLRLELRAQNEGIDVTRLALTDLGLAALTNVNRLQLYREGEVAPFAQATVDACNAISPTFAPKSFCAIMESQQLVIPKNDQVDVLVRVLMKADFEGAVSSSTDDGPGMLQLVLLKPTDFGTPGTPAGSITNSTVTARGFASSNVLLFNDNDTEAENEIIVGQSTAGPDQQITGRMNDTVLAKIVSITDANPDSDGSPIPTGMNNSIAEFKFTAAENGNVSNGPNSVVFDGLIFSVASFNVEFSSGGFELYNKMEQSQKIPCTQTATNGVFLVTCLRAGNTNVDLGIGTGEDITLVLDADIANAKVDQGQESVLQVSINSFSDRSQTVFGTGVGESHVLWSDNLNDPSPPVFFRWIESADTQVSSTAYVGSAPQSQIIDDGDQGYGRQGSWTDWSQGGYQGDLDYAAQGNGADTATWTFPVQSGKKYHVAVTWVEHSNRATNAPFTVNNGNGDVTLVVNQQNAPASFPDAGVQWQDLGVAGVQGTSLSVTLNNSANGYVIADAVRIEETTDPVTIVPQQGVQIIDNGDQGYNTQGSWTSWAQGGFLGDLDYAASGDGSLQSSWTFPVTAGKRYRVAATWVPHQNRATNAPFTIESDGKSAVLMMNQENAPSSFEDQGAQWEEFGVVAVSGNSLTVTLGNNANEYVIADAVRIEETTDPATITLGPVPQGTLFITQDLTPIRNRQLLGGTLTDTVLRLALRAEDEAIDVTRLVLTDLGQAALTNVDRLELYIEGESTSFAHATLDQCNNISLGIPAKSFCAVMVSQQLVIPDGEIVDVLVRVRMNSDVTGAVSSSTDDGAGMLQLALLRPTDFGTPGDEAGSKTDSTVTASGSTSQTTLLFNDNDTEADHEIIVGQSTAGPDQQITGHMNDTVLAKIVTIEDVNPDSDGSAVPVGMNHSIAEFKFTAAEHQNTKDGLNAATLDGIVFSVSSVNVEFDAAGFELFNKNSPSDRILCTQTATNGAFFVTCLRSGNAAVDLQMDSGEYITLVLEADIANNRVVAGQGSALQVSLADFSDRSKAVFGNGAGQSHIRWSDTLGESPEVFFQWIEYGDTQINSTSYQLS